MIRQTLYALAALATVTTPAIAGDWPACGTVDSFPGSTWKAETPAAQGWDEDALNEAKTYFDSIESAAVMVVHRGRLIADWGSTDEKYLIQSVRKPLVGALIGKLNEDGALSLDDTLEDLGINDTAPPLSTEERQATLRDLLHSRSGIFHSALYEVGRWTDDRLQLLREELISGGDKYGPGDYWVYNNWDFNALGTITEQAANEEIGPLFERWIAKPIAMEDYAPSDVSYTTKDSKTERFFRNWSEHRAYLFELSTRDLARFGLLYLACGNWDGAQVVPENWVLESLTGIDTRQGRPEDRLETFFGDYGYLWQIDRPGSRRYKDLTLKEPFYMGTGNRGHVVFGFPSLDLVIAHQVATTGGAGFRAQARRAREGSPTVSQSQMARLVSLIIEAHPGGMDAFMSED